MKLDFELIKTNGTGFPEGAVVIVTRLVVTRLRPCWGIASKGL